MTRSESAPRRSRRSRSTRPSSAGASSTKSNLSDGVRRLVPAVASAGRRVLLVLVAVLVSAATPRWRAAHELGSIRVSARLQKDGTYRIDATVDREPLPPGFGEGARIDPRFLPIRNLPPEREAHVAGVVAAAINGVEIA